VITAWGLAVSRLLGGEKIVFSSFCIFIIIIIIIIVIITISSSISISFVILLNCLYLNPRVLPFVRFPSPSRLGEGEG